MYTHANPNKNLSTKFPIKLNPIKVKILSSSSDTHSLLRSLVSLSWSNAQETNANLREKPSTNTLNPPSS